MLFSASTDASVYHVGSLLIQLSALLFILHPLTSSITNAALKTSLFPPSITSMPCKDFLSFSSIIEEIQHKIHPRKLNKYKLNLQKLILFNILPISIASFLQITDILLILFSSQILLNFHRLAFKGVQFSSSPQNLPQN